MTRFVRFTGWLAALALTLLCSGQPIAAQCGTKCGVERWKVKTLTDLDAAAVKLTPVPRSVAQLAALKAPKKRPPDKRAGQAERQTFRVRGWLHGFNKQRDKDLHLVLVDEEDMETTMIVEIPNAELCAGACDSPQAAKMRTAVDEFLKHFTAKRCFAIVEDDVLVTVTGVGFFDRKHSQQGVADNGIELHPVLEFKVEATGPFTAKCGD